MKNQVISSKKMSAESAQSYIDGIMAFKMFQNARKKSSGKKKSKPKQKS